MARKVVLLGSTGLLGKCLLRLLVQLEQVDEICCLVKSEPSALETGIYEGARKIRYVLTDFEQIKNKDCEVRKEFNADAVVCCLGTSRKMAGSREKQRLVEMQIPLTCAAVARGSGCGHFLVVSSMGANAGSPWFYNKVKGMMEEGLSMMMFPSLTIVRPAFVQRLFFKQSSLLSQLLVLHPELFPAHFRPVYPEIIAVHLASSLLKPPKGTRIIYNRVLATVPVDIK